MMPDNDYPHPLGLHVTENRTREEQKSKLRKTIAELDNSSDECLLACSDLRVMELEEVCADSFAYATIEEYEELVGFKVNEGFRTGWIMARTMNSHITALAESANDKLTTP